MLITKGQRIFVKYLGIYGTILEDRKQTIGRWLITLDDGTYCYASTRDIIPIFEENNVCSKCKQIIENA